MTQRLHLVTSGRPVDPPRNVLRGAQAHRAQRSITSLHRWPDPVTATAPVGETGG